MNMEAKHSEEIKNKRDIVMDLSDTETTAKYAGPCHRKPVWKY